MIALALAGTIAWFIFNIWLTIAVGLIIKFGGLDCSGLFSSYATRKQKAVGVIWIVVLTTAWVCWVYMLRNV